MADKSIEVELVHGEVLQLEKGDIIAVTVKRPLSFEEVARIEKSLLGKLPEGANILILTEDTKLSVLRGTNPIPETL